MQCSVWHLVIEMQIVDLHPSNQNFQLARAETEREKNGPFDRLSWDETASQADPKLHVM